MKKFLIAGLMMLTGIANAQSTPPNGFVNIPGTDVFRERIATVHGNTRGEVYRAELWAWTRDLGYIKITVGCSYDSYRIEKDGKEIVNRTYDPGHQFWEIKRAFCY